MDVSTYSDLLQTADTLIVKEITAMRNATPTSQRLSAALCFLATKEAFEYLAFANCNSTADTKQNTTRKVQGNEG
jgi:hypothetical protein